MLPRFILALGAVFAVFAPACVRAADLPRKKIVLIAGPITGHPKDTHEYEKNVILLKHLLDTSPNLRGRVTVEAHYKGWPADPRTLDDADTIFLTSDGGDHRLTDHPLYVGDRLQQLERQMQRGCGLVFFHWTTFHPASAHDKITEWVGGYFDYETGAGPRKWFSAIQTWNSSVTLGAPDHPIARGVKPFAMKEEFYYRLKFREPDPRLKPVLVTRPPNENADHIVGWAVERADGGRGFGTTGGHFYENWWNGDFRTLILNAIVWTAKLDVPAGGVESESASRFKALILTGHNHPAHEWRSVSGALVHALEQDPRLIAHVSENIEDLATDKINAFDLLVMNYCNWDRPGLSEASKANFVRYLENGGGLALIHFANGAFTDTLPNKESDWPEYRMRIARRVWDHRPGRSGHDRYGAFRVEIAGAAHPITAGLGTFDTTDELYYRQWGDLPIEPFAFALSQDTKQREPMAWAYDYGRGRVFQTVLGHDAPAIVKAAALIRRGSVWAARREQLSFDPPRELTDGALFRDGAQWSPQESLRRAEEVKKKTAAIETGPSKQANLAAAVRTGTASATAAPAKKVLPENQGLDEGGKYGHWGNDSETNWVDDRFQRMNTGPFFSSSLKTPAGLALKSIAIRVGENGEGAVCFDTKDLNWKAAWTGGFVKPTPARFGVIEMPRIDGRVEFPGAEGPGWLNAATRYKGLHLHNNRVVLSYQVGDMSVLESPWLDVSEGMNIFTRTLALGPSQESSSVVIASGKSDGSLSIKPHGLKNYFVVQNGDTQSLVILTLNDVAKLEIQNETNLVLAIQPHPKPEQIQIGFWSNADGSKLYPMKLIAASRMPLLTAPTNLTTLTQPGPARWGELLRTRGSVGTSSGPFAIDTLALPYENPWKALMFVSGHDFFSNGDVAVCTLHGDVWRVSGIDAKLEQLQWKRMATGLFQPLGLKVVDDKVLLLGRDQITRLHDSNSDGEADFCESFHHAIETSGGGHDYVACLERDAAGNLYYVDPKGLHRVSADGQRAELIASGWRNPNGLGVSPEGVLTVAPQEGEWTPVSQISEAKRGGYYGYGGPRVTPERPLGYDPHLCWIPRAIDNSSGGQVWVPRGLWGALGGQMLHLSYGRCEMALVLRDVSSGVPQGAYVPLKGRFLSGIMRGAFRRQDGHLYVSGLKGWVTSALRDGCLQRVRYTGGKLLLPVAWRAHENGLRLTFSEPLDPELATDPQSFSLEQWNYRYSSAYGSREYSVEHPDTPGHDAVEILAAKLLDDGRSIFLQVPKLREVMQLQVQYNLADASGKPLQGKLFATVNRPGEPFDLPKQ